MIHSDLEFVKMNKFDVVAELRIVNDESSYNLSLTILQFSG